MSQQEHNRTISARAFNLLCEDTPFWGIVTPARNVRMATPEEVAEAMRNEYDILSFYFDPHQGKIVAILWEEE